MVCILKAFSVHSTSVSLRHRVQVGIISNVMLINTSPEQGLKSGCCNEKDNV